MQNVFEQFRRMANCYFLFLAVLQTIPEISTTKGVPTVALPLSFVLGITLIKEAYEDYLRHVSVTPSLPCCTSLPAHLTGMRRRSPRPDAQDFLTALGCFWHQDDEINSRLTLRLQGEEWVEIPWQEVEVGDIIKVTHTIPCPGSFLALLLSWSHREPKFPQIWKRSPNALVVTVCVWWLP